MKVYFNSRDEKYKEPFGAVETGTEISFRIEAPEADGVVLRTWTDASGEYKVEMTRDGSFFTCSYTVPDEPCLCWYYFLIYKGSTVSFYGNNSKNLGGEGALYESEPDSFQITVYRQMHTPDWFKDSIVYYIFPDRFCRGSDLETRKKSAEAAQGHEGPGKTFIADWYEKPVYEKNEDGTIKNWKFYGGTLRGIIEKLPYIKSLGAGVIYLCPIFRSGSSHRYDTADYLAIDPLLGNDEIFKELCREAAKYGINIILDGVFSHTGCDSIYFDKYGNFGGTGAYAGPVSKYYSWYNFHEDGSYDCWWGDPNLPNVNETEPSYQEFICGKDGVIDKWMKLGAKGWRLDVADELPESFIKKIRRSVKNRPAGEDNILIGEVWEDASNKVSYGEMRSYLLGDELDGVMNYPFRLAIIDFLMNRCSSAEFCSKIMSIVENYPPEALFSVMNMLGSHDRMRPLTALSMGAGISEELQAGYELKDIDYELARRRLKLASIMQYVLPGVPAVYYGDEAGMQGHADPYNRAGYPWGREDEEILEHYIKLGKIYNQHTLLHDGSIRLYSLGDDVVSIERSSKDERIVTLVNRNWSDPVVVSAFTNGFDMAVDLYNGDSYEMPGDSLIVKIPPTGVKILHLT